MELSQPLFADVMVELDEAAVVVPLLLSTGFHMRTDLPEAVASTVRSVSCRASCTAIDPTPPAPPMISTAGAASGTGRVTSRRSKSISQAVIAVSGSAAASAQPRVDGLFPTMRSSTRCS